MIKRICCVGWIGMLPLITFAQPPATQPSQSVDLQAQVDQLKTENKSLSEALAQSQLARAAAEQRLAQLQTRLARSNAIIPTPLPQTRPPSTYSYRFNGSQVYLVPLQAK